MPLPGRLVLVRPGEAVCDVAGIIGGPRTCTGLTALGRGQAARAAAHLAAELGDGPIAAVYSARLPRLHETARILAAVLNVTARSEQTLNEQRYGQNVDGLAWGSVLRRFGGAPAAHPDQPLSDGGESWSACIRRTSRGLGRLLERHPGQSVVVVASSAAVSASFALMLALSSNSCSRAGVISVPGGITCWQQADTAGLRLSWRLVSHNDTAHLSGYRPVSLPVV